MTGSRGLLWWALLTCCRGAFSALRGHARPPLPRRPDELPRKLEPSKAPREPDKVNQTSRARQLLPAPPDEPPRPDPPEPPLQPDAREHIEIPPRVPPRPHALEGEYVDPDQIRRAPQALPDILGNVPHAPNDPGAIYVALDEPPIPPHQPDLVLHVNIPNPPRPDALEPIEIRPPVPPRRYAPRPRGAQEGEYVVPNQIRRAPQALPDILDNVPHAPNDPGAIYLQLDEPPIPPHQPDLVLRANIPNPPQPDALEPIEIPPPVPPRPRNAQEGEYVDPDQIRRAPQALPDVLGNVAHAPNDPEAIYLQLDEPPIPPHVPDLVLHANMPNPPQPDAPEAPLDQPDAREPIEIPPQVRPQPHAHEPLRQPDAREPIEFPPQIRPQPDLHEPLRQPDAREPIEIPLRLDAPEPLHRPDAPELIPLQEPGPDHVPHAEPINEVNPEVDLNDYARRPLPDPPIEVEVPYEPEPYQGPHPEPIYQVIPGEDLTDYARRPLPDPPIEVEVPHEPEPDQGPRAEPIYEVIPGEDLTDYARRPLPDPPIEVEVEVPYEPEPDQGSRAERTSDTQPAYVNVPDRTSPARRPLPAPPHPRQSHYDIVKNYLYSKWRNIRTRNGRENDSEFTCYELQ